MRYYEEALAISQEVGDRAGEANIIGNIGTTYARQGRTDLALIEMQQAFNIYRSIGSPPGEEWTAGWIRGLLDSLREAGNQTEYQRQCQQTAATTDLPITEWCP